MCSYYPELRRDGTRTLMAHWSTTRNSSETEQRRLMTHCSTTIRLNHVPSLLTCSVLDLRSAHLNPGQTEWCPSAWQPLTRWDVNRSSFPEAMKVDDMTWFQEVLCILLSYSFTQYLWDGQKTTLWTYIQEVTNPWAPGVPPDHGYSCECFWNWVSDLSRNFIVGYLFAS